MDEVVGDLGTFERLIERLGLENVGLNELAPEVREAAGASRVTGEGADLMKKQNEQGQDIPGTEVPVRMALTGSNGHGTFSGEARFPTGGNIQMHMEHTRDDGTKTMGDVSLNVDGSSAQVSTSQAGQLELHATRAADGKVTLEVRDLAHGEPILEPAEVATIDQGIVTFDFGEAEKARARLY